MKEKIIIMNDRHYLLLLMVLFFGGIFFVSDAQSEPPIPELYFCVEPRAEESDPYLIEFWDSIVFGIVIPEDAVVTMYSNTFYATAFYTINTNARNGGYIRMEDLGTANTYTRIPAPNACLTPETEEIFAKLPFQTIPIPVSIDHAIVVQHDGDNELDNPFQRVIAFTFGIENGEDGIIRNLQVIQNSETDPFLNFRYFDIPQSTPFMVTGNKDFGIGQSLPDTSDDSPPEFSRERPSDVRSFVKSDLEDLYGLDIFSLAQAANARIFINSGLLDNYRGTYIRISLAPNVVERIPPLEPDVIIRALPDAKANFVAIDQVENNPLQLDLPYRTSPLGQIMGDSTYRIVEIDEITGQLIIDFDGNPVIVESWLMEAVP